MFRFTARSRFSSRVDDIDIHSKFVDEPVDRLVATELGSRDAYKK